MANRRGRDAPLVTASREKAREAAANLADTVQAMTDEEKTVLQYCHRYGFCLWRNGYFWVPAPMEPAEDEETEETETEGGPSAEELAAYIAQLEKECEAS